MTEFMKCNFDISKIVVACFVAKGNGKASHKDRPNHGLALHLDGKKEYCFFDGRKLMVEKGDIIYLPKDSTYTVKSSLPGDCYAINFHVSNDISFPPFVFRVKSISKYLDSFSSARRIWDSKNIGYEMRCKALLYYVISDMQTESAEKYQPKSKYKVIEPAVNYINENFSLELLNISKLSAMCDITPEYFRKIFREHFGNSPIAYINKMKISRAKDLILSGMYSLGEVCELSGYSDFSHFSREFKKATGYPPSEYTENKKVQS
ncbi:MAG: helix-turn-helix transcriptional regulator [Clostridia bacterium]|nr:helix-turn-helix transcriptional regulator [Clostridia bacterium]